MLVNILDHSYGREVASLPLIHRVRVRSPFRWPCISGPDRNSSCAFHKFKVFLEVSLFSENGGNHTCLDNVEPRTQSLSPLNISFIVLSYSWYCCSWVLRRCNIWGHYRSFLRRAWKVRQIFLGGTHFGLEVLLRAVNLRHGTNGFTSLPKEIKIRIFTLWKNP